MWCQWLQKTCVCMCVFTRDCVRVRARKTDSGREREIERQIHSSLSTELSVHVRARERGDVVT